MLANGEMITKFYKPRGLLTSFFTKYETILRSVSQSDLKIIYSHVVNYKNTGRQFSFQMLCAEELNAE